MLSSTTNYLALLPSGESNKPDEWESETVHAHTTPKPDHNVSFSFSVEIGREKNKRREAFEWRAVKKSERDDGMQNGGFKLLWLSPNAEQSDLGEGSSSQSTTNNSEGNGVVAILSWYSSLASPKHPFDLTIMGGDEFNRLGERCLLMVLVTALGLWWLHGQGKTSHRAIAVAEKITGKGKSVA
ncbi:hypothetical protein F5Y10DRAFT_246585 [Nemania abortiva]|nr:hypothetical protein F5Y10DRAFT_246585 [Nemania abortiva]